MLNKAVKKKEKKGAGRAVRTLRSLVYICSLGVVLAVYNAVSLHRDVGLATGPAGSAQEQFFRDASERPDIATFFANLKPGGRLEMARNIGRYSDPELAKLCGMCLGTFDPVARATLTDSLAVVAKAHPDATAKLLILPGSFQQLAIATALRKAGDAALPLVAKEFSEADARPNAVAFLVSVGSSAIGPTLPYLASSNKDIRLAAADALGKLRAREAVATLTKMYGGSKEEERLAYLTALAGIGDPVSESLMAATLEDDSLPAPHRAQAALGLGTIGTPSSLTTLWSFTSVADKTLREGVISALQVAGDPALRIGQTSATNSIGREAILRVAGGVQTPFADSIIRSAFGDPTTSVLAAQVGGNRPSLVPTLIAQAHKSDATSRGDLVDSILRALATTSKGRSALKAMGSRQSQSPLGALAARRLSLMHG